MRKRLTVACAAVLAVLVAVVATNALLKRPRWSVNDRHIWWLIDGKDFFPATGEPGGMRGTDPELRPLDNAPVSFAGRKRPGTVRIFCVGGSTTQGWPFQHLISYPELLSLYLRDLLPGRDIEVINAGFMASDSTSDRALVTEILRYEPDIILLYEGRNEFWNYALHSSFRPKVLALHLWLLRHVYAYSAVNYVLQKKTFDHGAALRRFAQGGRRHDEEEVRSRMDRNIGSMAREARARGCGIAILTQVARWSAPQEDPRMAKVNRWLTGSASRHGLPLIDIDAAFRSAGLPESELIIPVSVHPDYRGYALMARTVAHGLHESRILQPEVSWRWDRLKKDVEYLREAGLTIDAVRTVYRKRLMRPAAGTPYGDFYREKLKRLARQDRLE